MVQSILRRSDYSAAWKTRTSFCGERLTRRSDDTLKVGSLKISPSPSISRSVQERGATANMFSTKSCDSALQRKKSQLISGRQISFRLRLPPLCDSIGTKASVASSMNRCRCARSLKTFHSFENQLSG
ncbi:hypothetical protein SRHO_G00282420 [Serrasalmus rhombeus]